MYKLGDYPTPGPRQEKLGHPLFSGCALVCLDSSASRCAVTDGGAGNQIVAHRQPSLSGGICSRMDSRQFQSQPNALDPTLSKAFRKFDQILCCSNGTKPAVAEGFDSRRPALWILIDDRQDGGRIPRDTPALARCECATTPDEAFQVAAIFKTVVTSTGKQGSEWYFHDARLMIETPRPVSRGLCVAAMRPQVPAASE